MKNTILLSIICICLISCREEQLTNSDLWPAIEPYEQGYLNVSNLHELYYELSGNPEGMPVFVLHGGPGGSTRPMMRQFFDPGKYLIVMHDQRGAGKSKPYTEIQENNTWNLVDDIEKLRKKLGLEKIILFGGSWGSTLALAYAETYPDHVSGMILRGIFTATQEEIDHFYHGGSRNFYPAEYDKFISSLPDPERIPRPDYMLELLMDSPPDSVHYYSDLWTWYEWVISDLDVNRQELKQWLADNNPHAFALIENYYMANLCFFEPYQIWKNLYKIKHIPTIIVNGRFDMPCPPITAYKLYKGLPLSELVIIEKEGHFGPGISNALVKATDKLYVKLSK